MAMAITVADDPMARLEQECRHTSLKLEWTSAKITGLVVKVDQVHQQVVVESQVLAVIAVGAALCFIFSASCCSCSL